MADYDDIEPGEGLEAYELEEQQALVEDAKQRMKPLHRRWKALRTQYRTGRWTGDSAETVSYDTDGQLLDELPDMVPETVNMTLSHLNVIVSSVIDRAPEHTAVPTAGGMESEQARHAVEALLRHQWRRTEGTDALRRATWDMCLVGKGFLKVAGSLVERERPRDPQEIEMELRRAAAAEVQAALAEGRQPDPDAMVSGIEPVDVVQDWQPWVTRVRPEDMFVGVSATDLRDVPWVAQRIVKPADEVYANPAYKDAIDDGCDVKTDTYESARGESGTSDPMGRGSHQSDRPFEYATLYEFYDMRARRLTVFQLGADKPLFDEPLPWSHDHPPYVDLSNYLDGDEFWTFGEVENIASIQEMLNELFEEVNLNARRSGNKFLVDDRIIDDDLQALLESDEHEVVAKVNLPQGVSMRDVVMAVERPGLPSDVYETLAMLRNAMQDILGINDFQAGGMGADRMSATAASLVEGIATIRAADKIREVEKAAARAGQIMLWLSQEYLPDDTAVRIVGEDDAPGWMQVSKAAIGGDFLVSVQPESTKALNPQARQQKALQGIQEIIPALVDLGIDPKPAMRSFLRDLGHDPEVLMAQQLPPEPPPEDQQPQGGRMGPLPQGEFLQPRMPGDVPAEDPTRAGTTAALDASAAPFPEAELAGDRLA